MANNVILKNCETVAKCQSFVFVVVVVVWFGWFVVVVVVKKKKSFLFILTSLVGRLWFTLFPPPHTPTPTPVPF